VIRAGLPTAIRPAGALPVTQRTAPTGIVIADRASRPINMAPRSPIPLSAARTRPDGSTPFRAAENVGVFHEIRTCRWRKRRRKGYRRDARRWRGGRQRHGDEAGNDALIHNGFPRLLPVMPAPMAARRVPLLCPNIGGHQVRLRASPKIRLEHAPRVVPDRPIVPLPILPMRPLPCAPTGVVNFLHRVSGRRKRCDR